MEIQQIDILFRLVIAHILADFVFQSKRNKEGELSRYFIVHLLLVGILTYLMLPGWTYILPSLTIMLAHGLIDLASFRLMKNKTTTFFVNQALHLGVLVILWLFISDNTLAEVWSGIRGFLYTPTTLILFASYLAITLPAGAMIGLLTKRWQSEIKDVNTDSLKDAGKWIGITERILVLTFILIGQWAAVGFLLGAKSVLRFGDIKDGHQQKKTEYILIGTFLSFLLAIVLGILVHYYLEKQV